VQWIAALQVIKSIVSNIGGGEHRCIRPGAETRLSETLQDLGPRTPAPMADLRPPRPNDPDHLEGGKRCPIRDATFSPLARRAQAAAAPIR
jgi:hypothetical protein